MHKGIKLKTKNSNAQISDKTGIQMVKKILVAECCGFKMAFKNLNESPKTGPENPSF